MHVCDCISICGVDEHIALTPAGMIKNACAMVKCWIKLLPLLEKGNGHQTIWHLDTRYI